MFRTTLTVLALSLCLLGEAPGQKWQKLSPSVQPSARIFSGMAYDSARDKIVLFGGSTLSASLNDTWEFDGASWTVKAPSKSPAAREKFAIAYDVGRKKVVLFGGLSWKSRKTFGDTWEWDGVRWKDVSPASGPVPRAAAGMCYHSGLGKVVLIGGHNPGVLSDMWAFDGKSWTPLPKISTGQGRTAASVTYAASSNNLVVFGGWVGSYKDLDDTQHWSARFGWKKMGTLIAPSKRHYPASYNDPRINRTILFGGVHEPGKWGVSIAQNDLWYWDGSAWKEIKLALKPAARWGHSFAYDSKRSRAIMFGGRPNATSGPLAAATWQFRSGSPASFASLGGGCATSMKLIPALSAPTLPVLGKSMVLHLKDAGISSYPLSAGALFIGFTPTKIDLRLLGAPGCTAYANPHVTMVIQTDFNGAWTSAPFPIPGNPNLLGATFYNQVFVYDPKANALKLVASNGAKATIGF